jgi:ATP-dependent 26S proteasome regulatory subunit
VLVVAAANRPQVLDAALLRVGRLDRHIYMGPPSEEDREAIFGIYVGRMAHEEGLDVGELARLTERATGAEIENICREAGLRAMRGGAAVVGREHFDAALGEWEPRLSRKEVEAYAQVMATHDRPRRQGRTMRI